MKHRIYYALVVLVLLTGVTFILRNVVSGTGSPDSAITPQEFQHQIVLLVNEERTKAELKPLSENLELDVSAKNKGDDMFAKDYWAHNSPDGTEPWAQFIKAGYAYRHAGENLACNFSSPEGTVSAWMNSPAHKAAILKPEYTETGVWAGEGKFDGNESFLIVQHFATPL